MPGSGLPTNRRRALGTILILLIVFIWVASSFLSQSLQEDQNFARPYFITYFNTSSFTMYLIPVLWRKLRKRARENRSDSAVDGAVNGFRGGARADGSRHGSPRWVYSDFNSNQSEYGQQAWSQAARGNAEGFMATPVESNAGKHVSPTRSENGGGFRQAQVLHESQRTAHDDAEIDGTLEVTMDYPEYNPESRLNAGIVADETIMVEPLPLQKVAQLALFFCLFWFSANYFQNVSLGLTSVSSSTILSSVSGLFTLIIGTFVRVETFTPLKFLSVVIAFVGVVLISRDDNAQSPMPGDSTGQYPSVRVTLLGDFLALLGAFFYGVYSVMLKVFIPNEEAVSPTTFLGFVGLWNIVLLWPGFFILNALGIENLEFPKDEQSLKTLIISLVLNALIGTFLSDYIWLIAVLLTSPLIVTVGLSLTIPLAMVGEWFLDGIAVKLLHVLGGALVVAGFLGVTVPEDATTTPQREDDEQPLTLMKWIKQPMFTGTTRPGGWRQLSTEEIPTGDEEPPVSNPVTNSYALPSGDPSSGVDGLPGQRLRAESGVSLHTIR
ncbi:hypothetical protein M427DRAFT_125966 [Gonapodya prolifera JEL478]|uniref:EamA domain-containing protein n=1 Tax=Gonapodya prolifera (strain JEL478) TaxID=1344416 RepID=A0A139A669_GONPJ|nr:hypothetical protein M427DRAFT_125966 [Gonapodya prolifera JEL478]|eukprot:KXS12224.1 hypothetical protein M427DRAFT_125966 [Gonapodya prolifera JEL478]